MWAWIVLGVGWAAAAYWGWSTYRRARMAEPAHLPAAIFMRVRIAVGYGISLAILLALSFASLQLAIAERTKVASWAAAASMGGAVVGGIVLWRRVWRRRRGHAGIS